jgi:hypothetical protein
MPDLLIRDLDAKTITRLKKRAKNAVVTADRKFHAAVTASPLATRILWVEDTLER